MPVKIGDIVAIRVTFGKRSTERASTCPNSWWVVSSSSMPAQEKYGLAE
ncbi:hypothetical protein CHA_P10083 [Pseudomonas phage CHA_P1]|uniref:Uncharacterized protein n=1 Tax=Pseudomonas phage CHA_P1 TaxID=1327965 RepID=V5JWT9_9CAUD|nr:hypothetical protein X837_gp083 [Pseudomonas phage CHA_P1]AGR89037.1 hypothetical protein CHA_P10083 [Pseudomonas phage CHA_P1]